MELIDLIRSLQALQALGLSVPTNGEGGTSIIVEPLSIKAASGGLINTTERRIQTLASEEAKPRVSIIKDNVVIDGQHAINEDHATEEINASQEVRVLDVDAQNTAPRKKSFLDAVNGSSLGIPLKVAPIRVEGGNIIIEVDEDDIQKEI